MKSNVMSRLDLQSKFNNTKVDKFIDNSSSSDDDSDDES